MKVTIHTRETTSRAAMARMSAHETLPAHPGSASTAAFALLMASTASGDSVASAPLWLSSSPLGAISITDASHPCKCNAPQKLAPSGLRSRRNERTGTDGNARRRAALL